MQTEREGKREMIYKMAIVEDEAVAAKELNAMIEQYGRDCAPMDEYRVSVFSNAYNFLLKREVYDVVFLDIQMAGMNGMQAAREIRKRDDNVLIVFVTNMAQYALESYDVHAYDFILKPLTYGNFYMKFRRVLKELEHKQTDAFCTLATRFEKRQVRISDIVYVEISSHDLVFHMADESRIHILGTLNEWEQKLSPYHFARCNACFLVNMRYITALNGDSLVAGGHELRISRTKKQAFLSEFAKYGGGSR